MSGTQHEGPSVIEQLAAYVTGEVFDKLPAATVVAARRAILDTLGVTLAGAVEPTAERVRAMIEHRRAGQEATIVGKKVVSSAAKIQWVKLPRDCPAARYLSGKISEMKTQITAPWPMACAAMKAKMHAGTIAKWPE